MARQLVDSLSKPFEPASYRNEHKKLVLEMVQRKMEGEEVPVAAEAPEPAPVPDLMAALRASIDQAKGSTSGDSEDGASDGAAKKGRSNGKASSKSGGGKGSTARGGSGGKGSGGAKGKRAAAKS